jgi:hypothetical protein
VRDVYTGIDPLVITEGCRASKVGDLLEVGRSGFSRGAVARSLGGTCRIGN